MLLIFFEFEVCLVVADGVLDGLASFVNTNAVDPVEVNFEVVELGGVLFVLHSVIGGRRQSGIDVLAKVFGALVGHEFRRVLRLEGRYLV